MKQIDYVALKAAMTAKGYTMSEGDGWTAGDDNNYKSYVYLHANDVPLQVGKMGQAYPGVLPCPFPGNEDCGSPDRQVVSIAVVPATATVGEGQTTQLTATATYDDASTGDVTSTATWTSDHAEFATVAAGTVTGVAAGSASVAATVDGISGSSTITVQAAGATLQSIVIQGSNTIVEGASAELTVLGTYSDSSTAEVSEGVVWSSTDTGVATVADGVITTVAAGTTSIGAEVDGIVAPAFALEVTEPVTLTSITIAGANSTLMGETLNLVATGTFSDGSTLDVTQDAVWASSDTAVADVVKGTALGKAPGTTNITATWGGTITSSIFAVEVEAFIASITVGGDNTVAVGGTANLTATANMSDSTTVDITAEATWQTLSAGFATVAANGVVTGVAEGTAHIIAEYGSTVSSQYQVTVTAA